MASQAAVRLHRSGVELDLCPPIGGAITAFRWRGRMCCGRQARPA